MAGPVIETRLHVPRRRRALVARPRLEERLARVAESALTLVSAPAGPPRRALPTPHPGLGMVVVEDAGCRRLPSATAM